MSSIRGVNVGGNLFDVTDSSNVAPIETTNFATRGYAVDRCFIMADGLLYRATAEIESGDPIVINGNCKRTTLDEIISVIETDSDLIAPTEDGATSSADYAVGNEIVRSGILYKVISAITQGDAFAIGSNIDIAGSITSQIQTLTNNDNAMLNELGAKNLLSITATSQTLNGITFTVNNDGSITVNGTATNAIDLRVNGYNTRFKNKKYVLTGGYSNDLSLKIFTLNTVAEIGDDHGDGVEFIASDSERYGIYIHVSNGATVSNVILYPMIRPASIEDDTYAPYAMTNRDLTKKLVEEDFHGESELTFARCTYVSGGYWIDGNTVIINIRVSYTQSGITIAGFPAYSQKGESSNYVPLVGYDTANEKAFYGYLDSNGQAHMPAAYTPTNGMLLLHACYIKTV